MKEHRTSNAGHRTSNQTAVRNVIDELTPTRKRVFDLEERLLIFACAIIDVSESLPTTRTGNHVAGQLLRSGTSPYSNHGEAESAESQDDFIHKLKVCLKELRETRRWLRLVDRRKWLAGAEQLPLALREVEELIRIFAASLQTARRNRARASSAAQPTA